LVKIVHINLKKSYLHLTIYDEGSYTYIFSSLPTADVAIIQNHVGHMVSFIEYIALDEDHSDGNITAACGLIGYVQGFQ